MLLIISVCILIAAATVASPKEGTGCWGKEWEKIHSDCRIKYPPVRKNVELVDINDLVECMARRITLYNESGSINIDKWFDFFRPEVTNQTAFDNYKEEMKECQDSAVPSKLEGGPLREFYACLDFYASDLSLAVDCSDLRESNSVGVAKDMLLRYSPHNLPFLP